MVKNATKSDMWVEAIKFFYFVLVQRVEEIFVIMVNKKIGWVFRKMRREGKFETLKRCCNWQKTKKKEHRADRENSEHVQQAKRLGCTVTSPSQ